MEPRFPPLSGTANFFNRQGGLPPNPYLNSTNLQRSKSNTQLGYSPFKKTYTNVSSRLRQREEQSDINLNAMIEDGEVFPHDMLLLLTDEARNIKNFKAKIQKEKLKVGSDFDVFKKEIMHIIEDLKISIVAELDLVYKVYIEKYAMMKSEIMEVRRLKKQIHSQNIAQSEISKLITVQHNASNLDIVKELEEEVISIRNYKITNYLNELQKKKLTPLSDISRQLIIMTTSPIEFYNTNVTNSQLGELKQNFSHFTKHMFAALGEFVRSPQTLFEMSKGGNALNQPLLKGIDFSKVSERPVQPQPPQRRKRDFAISQSQQILSTDWVEDVTLRHINTIQPEHTDSVLCAIAINNKTLVTGGKDGLLVVQTLDGERIAALQAHQAGICTLSLIEDNGVIYLTSGGDHGCNSIVIWDTTSWAIKAKIKAHSAAVTSIVDMCDGQTLVSGSYDKKINVYNYKKSAVKFSLPNNRSSVTSMLLNSSRNKLISCGFDSMMFVWAITRDQAGVVESIGIQRVIQNNCIICCLNGSMLRPDTIVAGTQDGKIKFWNLSTGEVEKTLTANNNLIIDMVLIERQSKPNNPLVLSCSSKDRSLVLTRTQTGNNEVIDLGGRNYIEFGCGISPKIIFARYSNAPIIGLVNQSSTQREVNLFDLDLK